MAVSEHKDKAGKQRAKVAILTVSDTRTKENDESGKLAAELLNSKGHKVVVHKVLPNDKYKIKKQIKNLLADDVNLIITIGGTGISKKDLTADVVRSFINKELVGFGELFRYMSYQDIGTATILSRATLGITENKKILLALPGSIAAVKIGLESILLKELDHIIWELNRYA